MSLLERRRMLLEAAGSDLDGKYVAFIQTKAVSPYDGGVYLSSDYGQTFEKIADFNWGVTAANAFNKPTVDVEGGKPVVYFASGSAVSKTVIYKWKDGTVSPFVTGSGTAYAKQSLHCIENNALLWASCGESKIYLISGSNNLTNLGSVTNLSYMCPSSPKNRRKTGYLTFASYYNVSSYKDVFWTKGYTSPANFSASLISVNANSSLPASSSKPGAGYYGDIDISTDGQTIGAIYPGNGGLIVGEGLQGSSQYWHYNLKNTFISEGTSNFCNGFTLSKNKSFVGYRYSTDNSNYTNRVARYSTLIPSTSSLEITSTIPAPTLGNYTQYGYYSMSLWSNTKGDKLIFKGQSYGSTDTPICYSHDAGVTWNKSSYPSGSNTYVLGVDVYRT